MKTTNGVMHDYVLGESFYNACAYDNPVTESREVYENQTLVWALPASIIYATYAQSVIDYWYPTYPRFYPGWLCGNILNLLDHIQ